MQLPRQQNGDKYSLYLLEPSFEHCGVFCFLGIAISNAFILQVLPFVVLSPIIGYVAVYLLLSSIDRLGKKTYSLPALPLFRAFLLNWVTDQNEPLEKHLEAMGGDADIEVTLLKFDACQTQSSNNCSSSASRSIQKHRK